MNLRLLRDPSRFNATIGRLFIGEAFECYVLEDQVRERPGVAVAAWKVKGHAAIPAGTYRVVITDSPRFGEPMPLLLDVPGFEGIRIHPGNTHADTEGCLIPGRRRGVATVRESRVAYRALFAKIAAALAARDEVLLTIENPAYDVAAAAAA